MSPTLPHPPHPIAEPALAASNGPSRRAYLGWAAAGLAAPLLQACGGGDSGPGFLSAPPAPPDAADAASVRWCRDAIRAALGRSGSATTAVSVALLADDRVVWREAFGHASREPDVPASPDSRVNVGSVAKMVATLAVMVLRDRGQLALDQPLAQLLPAFRMRSPGFTRITVRHLVCHASGVPGTNSRNLFNFTPNPGYEQDTLDALAQSHLKHEPGELAVYCNDGFTLIEPLVRQLTGLPFADFVQREIFDPLEMRLSGYASAAAAEGSFVHPVRDGRQLPQEMTAAFATGGVVTTPTDMMKLARLFLDEGRYAGRRIVSAQSIREMAVSQGERMRIHSRTATVSRWGLGWDSVQQPAMDAAGLLGWEKGGDTFFFTTKFIVLPQARLAVMISGNGSDYGALALAEGLLLRVAQERGAIRALPPALVPAVPPAAPPTQDIADLVGVYANDAAPWQVAAADDGALMLTRWSAQGRWEPVLGALRPRSDGGWWADGRATASFRFQTIHGHRYLVFRGLASHQLYWNESAVGEWLPPLSTPLPPAWQGRLGSRWACINESPQSLMQRFGPVRGRIDALAALPGYILWNNEQVLRIVDDHEAGMTIKVPGFSGRDLVELRVVASGCQEELHSGSLVFRRMPGAETDAGDAGDATGSGDATEATAAGDAAGAGDGATACTLEPQLLASRSVH